jgi:hypothetical protein
MAIAARVFASCTSAGAANGVSAAPGPAKKLFVDLAGTTMPIYDPNGGPAKQAHLFVAVPEISRVLLHRP